MNDAILLIGVRLDIIPWQSMVLGRLEIVIRFWLLLMITITDFPDGFCQLVIGKPGVCEAGPRSVLGVAWISPPKFLIAFLSNAQYIMANGTVSSGGLDEKLA